MVNRIPSIGNLGMNPEMRRFGQRDVVMTRMSLATNEIFRGISDNPLSNPNRFTLIAWGRLAIRANANLVRGKIVVKGKVVYCTFTDKTEIL